MTSTTKTAAKTAATSTKTEVAETKVPNKGPYRSAPDFLTALKSAKSLAKGNPELLSAIQLLTHIAWKKPTDAVGWTEGTTASVTEYADELAVPVGTSIKVAVDAALKAAVKAAGTDPQRDALKALTAIVRAYEKA